MSESADQPRLIKRYTNRKLYDTRDSRYVTLDRVAELVRNGEQLRIVDNGSKEDLTQVTLAQIIYEEQKNGQGDAAMEGSLRNFITQGRHRLMSSFREGPFGRFIDWAEELTGEIHRGADDRVRALLEGAAEHVRHLQAEVSRLQARIEELETRIRQPGEKTTDKPEPPDEVE